MHKKGTQNTRWLLTGRAGVLQTLNAPCESAYEQDRVAFLAFGKRITRCAIDLVGMALCLTHDQVHGLSASRKQRLVVSHRSLVACESVHRMLRGQQVLTRL